MSTASLLTPWTTGNHDRFPTLPGGKRDIIFDHSHIDTWKYMEGLLAAGKVKGIGVCNVSELPSRLPLLLSVPAHP